MPPQAPPAAAPRAGMPPAARYWIDRLLASDPALDHLRTGARALLTAALGAGLLLPLARLLQQPTPVALVGIIAPLMSVVALQDATRRRRLTTLALLPLVAVPVILLGGWAGGSTWLSGGLFLLLIALSFEARRIGPRASGLATLACQSYFYALLLQLDQGHAAGLALFVAAGTAIAAVVRFALVPERPHAVLRQQLRALRAGVSVLLGDLVRSLGPGGDTGSRRAAARISRLNDLSLDIESQLALHDRDRRPDGPGPAPDEALRDRVLHAGIAAETLATAVAAAARSGAGAPGVEAMRSDLLALRQGVAAPAGAGLPLAGDLAWRFRRAIDVLAHEAPWRLPLPALRDEGEAAGPAPAPAGGPVGWRRWWVLDAPRRAALQATAAAAVSVAAGRALSADHWYWAVFAAYIVFTQAESIGQALSRAWQRTLASVAGLAAGLGLAGLVHGSTGVELALLFTFIAAGFYAFRAFQPAYVLLLTAMLAMLYGLMGLPTEGLLLLRLEETLAGAAIAVLASVLVVPLRTGERADTASAAVLREAAAVVRATYAGGSRTAPRDAVRELDRRLRSLRQVLGPVTMPSYPAPKAPHRERLGQLSVLVYSVRHLYHLNARHPDAGGDALAGRARAVAARLDAAAAALEGDPGGGLPPPAPDDGSGDGATELSRISRQWLLQADGVARAVVTTVQQVR